MNTTTKRSRATKGADKIADAIRAQLLQRGCRNEDISLDWFPDLHRLSSVEAPELRAAVADSGNVLQMFSREELEVSGEQLERESVLAKINLVVESLQAGLP